MRLTLDIDNASKRHFQGILKFITYMFPHKNVCLNRSALGKGFHIKVYGLDYSFKGLIPFRKLFDDPKRLAIDLERWDKGICSQVMFTKKGNNWIKEIEHVK